MSVKGATGIIPINSNHVTDFNNICKLQSILSTYNLCQSELQLLEKGLWWYQTWTCLLDWLAFVYEKKFPRHVIYELHHISLVLISMTLYSKLTSRDSTSSVGTLQWRHNEHDGISNHQPHDCLLKRLFRVQIKETSKLHVTGHCEGNSPVNSQHKRPVTQKMFPFDDVIMRLRDSTRILICDDQAGKK